MLPQFHDAARRYVLPDRRLRPVSVNLVSFFWDNVAFIS